jgi:hemoglobin/transferrin/lactoferrin receptor protein
MRILSRRGSSRGISLLLSLLLSQAAYAQDSISGTVKDSSGGALPGATVTILNTASGREVVLVVDEAGKYAVDGLPDGPYRVTARLPGFNDSGRSLSLPVAGSQDFVLSLGSISEAITVTAARGERAASDIPQIVTVVSEADMDNRRPQGVQDAIERAPSMRNADPNPYRTRPQFRGLQGSRVLIVVDGERLNNSRFGADFGGISPSLVDPSQVKSIEVVGGSASSLYGSDSIAGTVNIITKGPEYAANGQKRFDLRADIDGGSNNEFKRGVVAAGFAGQKWGLRASVSAFDYGEFKSGGQPITRAEVLALGRFAVQVGALVGRNDIANRYTIYDLPKNASIPNSQGEGKTLSADFRFSPAPNHDIRVRAISNRYKNLGIPTGQPPLDITDRESAFQDYDKFAGRWEARDLTSWLPRLSVGVYQQLFDRSQNDTQFTLGGSFTSVIGAGGVAVNSLNGNLSTFTPSTKTDTVDHSDTVGGDLQINIIPFKNAQFTTGLNYSKDKYEGQVTNSILNPAGGVVSRTVGPANVPTNEYKNFAWFNQLEINIGDYIRLSGGVRLDNWKTEALPTPGFASAAVGALVNGLPVLATNPGALNVSGASGAAGLIQGTSSITSNKNVTTGNIGATFPLKGGFTPYVRYATSFRQPDATSQYLIRNFGSAVISILGLPNTQLKPERGKNIEAGVKIDRSKWRAMAGYFDNKLEDAILSGFSSSFCIRPSPPNQVPTPFPPCVFTGQHSATFFQATNTGKADIKGWEFMGEASIPVGTAGSFTPYLTLSGIKATNVTADNDRKRIVAAFYSRTDLPLELEGSESDVPFNALPNLQGTAALRFTNATGKWWAEYEYYFTSRITRIDPNNLASGGTTLYHLLASYYGIDRHGLRGGITVGSKENPVRLTASVENLTDELYFAPQQPSFAPGRSFRFGATFNWKKLF